ncbi:hypothetical protein, partial [Zavarzinella formosa]|uniref:hypothetical protein n=1 Tax=Zavarzinella formosa TaxID=360055 RepID=UPI00187DAAA6
GAAPRHSVQQQYSGSTLQGTTDDSLLTVALDKTGSTTYRNRLEMAGSRGGGTTATATRWELGTEVFNQKQQEKHDTDSNKYGLRTTGNFSFVLNTTGNSLYSQTQVRQVNRDASSYSSNMQPSELAAAMVSLDTGSQSGQTLTLTTTKSVQSDESSDLTQSMKQWKFPVAGEAARSFESTALNGSSSSTDSMTSTSTDVNGYRTGGSLTADRTGSQAMTLNQVVNRRDDQPKIVVNGSASMMSMGESNPVVLAAADYGGFSLSTDTLHRESQSSVVTHEVMTADPGAGSMMSFPFVGDSTSPMTGGAAGFRTVSLSRGTTGSELADTNHVSHLEATQKRGDSYWEAVSNPAEDTTSDATSDKHTQNTFQQTETGSTDSTGTYSIVSMLAKAGNETHAETGHTLARTRDYASGVLDNGSADGLSSFGGASVRSSKESWMDGQGTSLFTVSRTQTDWANQKRIDDLRSHVIGHDLANQSLRVVTQKEGTGSMMTGGDWANLPNRTPHDNSAMTFNKTTGGDHDIELAGHDRWKIDPYLGTGTFVFNVDQARIDVRTVDHSRAEQEGSNDKREFDLSGQAPPTQPVTGELDRGLTNDSAGTFVSVADAVSDFRIRADAYQDFALNTWQLTSFQVDGTSASTVALDQTALLTFVNRQTASNQVENGTNTSQRKTTTTEGFTLGYGASRNGSAWSADRYSLDQWGGESYNFAQTLTKTQTNNDFWLTAGKFGLKVSLFATNLFLDSNWVRSTTKSAFYITANGQSSYASSRRGVGEGATYSNRRSGSDNYVSSRRAAPDINDAINNQALSDLMGMQTGNGLMTAMAGQGAYKSQISSVAWDEEVEGKIEGGVPVEKGRHTMFSGSDGERSQMWRHREADVSQAPSIVIPKTDVRRTESTTTGYMTDSRSGTLSSESLGTGTRSSRSMTSTFDETATRETPEHQGYNWLGSLETVDASSEYHHRAGNSTMTLSFRGSLKTTNRFLDPASR